MGNSKGTREKENDLTNSNESLAEYREHYFVEKVILNGMII